MGVKTSSAQGRRRRQSRQPAARRLRRIAAAVDGRDGGQDAAALAVVLAHASGADLMLAEIEPDLARLVPGATAHLRHPPTGERLDPVGDRSGGPARLVTRPGASVARGLTAVVREQRRDLLVVGSSPRARPGEVAIGRATRALLHELPCALAVAPAGLATRTSVPLQRIIVGFDGGPQARWALALAAGIVRAGGAHLTVCGVIDDRIPGSVWPRLWLGAISDAWGEAMAEEEAALGDQIAGALAGLGIDADVELVRGRAGEVLTERSGDGDLLVIGSRRWGAPARVILGGTGEALAHGARCPLLLVPRPGRG